jgi:hypothetical protein
VSRKHLIFRICKDKCLRCPNIAHRTHAQNFWNDPTSDCLAARHSAIERDYTKPDRAAIGLRFGVRSSYKTPDFFPNRLVNDVGEAHARPRNLSSILTSISVSLVSRQIGRAALVLCEPGF